jgi:hypothetical protein
VVFSSYSSFFPQKYITNVKGKENTNAVPKLKWNQLGFMVFNTSLKKYFIYIVVVSFIAGRNWSNWRKPPTCYT